MPEELTDTEIKKALECCISPPSDYRCCPCPYIDVDNCKQAVLIVALDLINRQDFKIHQLEKQVSEIQNANLIDFKGTIGNYKAENENLKAEVERLKDILICFMGALSKVRNIDDIESISVIPLMTELNKGIRAEIKAEAYKECLEKVEQRDVSESDFYIMVKKAEFDNLLNELVGDGDGK